MWATLFEHDLQTIAERLVRLGHLNPARHYTRVFIAAASQTSDARLKTLAGLAFLYSIVRFVEAYGLWRMRTWAEWFAIISGGIYIPLEVFEIAAHDAVQVACGHLLTPAEIAPS